MYAAVQDGCRLSTKTPIAHQSRERFDHHVALLTKELGGRLLCNIDLAKTSRHFNANGLPKVGRGGK
jgi:hypothetical protein